MSNQIVFITPEVAPLVKTGGLADVCGSLPKHLDKQGYEVRIVLPWYKSIDGEIIDSTLVKLSGREIKITFGQTSVHNVPVGLVGHPPTFKREGLYDQNGNPYPDNDRRFILFSKAGIQLADHLFDPDLFHCHDWFTGTVPMLLNHDDNLSKRPTVFTIHNLQYQGVFESDSFRYTGLSWGHFHSDTAEQNGDLNLLKAGINEADRLTTVSPTYSQEIQTEALGEGLEDSLRDRSDDLTGILNGIDTNTWNPESDQHLKEEERFSVDDLEGKQTVKNSLINQFNFSTEEDRPLIGMVGRMVAQKGFELITDHWNTLSTLKARWIILGTGESKLEHELKQLERLDPDIIHCEIDFNEELAHRIEAGSDIFCMPSRYEPCGLNQMYSMRYGTIPVVHETGGLADTVVDPANGDSPTGFSFKPFDGDQLVEAVQSAVNIYHDNPELWSELQQNGMNRDWSWDHSASSYAELYEEVLN